MKYKRNKKYCKNCSNYEITKAFDICKRHWAINEFNGQSAGICETNFYPNINGDCEYYNKKCDFETANKNIYRNAVDMITEIDEVNSEM